MRQFSAVSEGDLTDGYDSDGALGPFYDAVDRMVEILEDEESHVESLGSLSATEAPPEATTELLSAPSNEAEFLSMSAAQLMAALESKKLSRQGNKDALRERLLGDMMLINDAQNVLTNRSAAATNEYTACQTTPG